MREEVIGSARLFLGDCREVLPTLQVDLCLTDPPYGIGLDTKNATRKRSHRPYSPRGVALDHSAVIGDDMPFEPSHLLQFQAAVLWGANNYADCLPASSCWFSWDRKAGKAADSDITDCELAWVRGLKIRTVRQFSHMWAGFQRDSETGHRHLHPTQKPVALFSWCLSFFPNAVAVVDPYMGSGPCGVACLRDSRRFIGIELDPKHFDTACRRIEAAQRQADLFVPQPSLEAAYDAPFRDLFAGGAP